MQLIVLLILFCMGMMILPLSIVFFLLFINKKATRKVKEEDTYLQEREVAAPSWDKQQVTVMYRKNLMDTFIRENFHEVKNWYIPGNDIFLSCFYDPNWNNGIYHIRITYLDGTEKPYRILVNPETGSMQVEEYIHKEPTNMGSNSNNPDNVSSLQSSKEPAEEQKENETPKKEAPSAEDPSVEEEMEKNAFFKRKDVIHSLKEESDIIIKGSLPENDFDTIRLFLMRKYGAQLIRMDSGWLISFN